MSEVKVSFYSVPPVRVHIFFSFFDCRIWSVVVFLGFFFFFKPTIHLPRADVWKIKMWTQVCYCSCTRCNLLCVHSPVLPVHLSPSSSLFFPPILYVNIDLVWCGTDWTASSLLMYFFSSPFSPCSMMSLLYTVHFYLYKVILCSSSSSLSTLYGFDQDPWPASQRGTWTIIQAF